MDFKRLGRRGLIKNIAPSRGGLTGSRALRPLACRLRSGGFHIQSVAWMDGRDLSEAVMGRIAMAAQRDSSATEPLVTIERRTGRGPVFRPAERLTPSQGLE